MEKASWICILTRLIWHEVDFFCKNEKDISEILSILEKILPQYIYYTAWTFTSLSRNFEVKL